MIAFAWRVDFLGALPGDDPDLKPHFYPARPFLLPHVITDNPLTGAHLLKPRVRDLFMVIIIGFLCFSWHLPLLLVMCTVDEWNRQERRPVTASPAASQSPGGTPDRIDPGSPAPACLARRHWAVTAQRSGFRAEHATLVISCALIVNPCVMKHAEHVTDPAPAATARMPRVMGVSRPSGITTPAGRTPWKIPK